MRVLVPHRKQFGWRVHKDGRRCTCSPLRAAATNSMCPVAWMAAHIPACPLASLDYESGLECDSFLIKCEGDPWHGRMVASISCRWGHGLEADATSDYESKLARRSYVVGRGGSPNRPVAIRVNRPLPNMILETARLILRLFREEDFDLVANFGSWHRHRADGTWAGSPCHFVINRERWLAIGAV